MTTSDNGKVFIQGFEGCKLQAYKCPAGIWTIGYGNTYYEDGTKVKDGDKITIERAKQLFNLLLPKYENIVKSRIKVLLNQNQFDSLVSFAYNTGGSDTLFLYINSNESKEKIYNWWCNHYTMGNGKVLPGLVRRRKAEADLFFKPC